MGRLSSKVISEIRKNNLCTRREKVTQLSDFFNSKDVKSVDKLVKMGHDPLHACYISAQNMVSHYCENILGLAALEECRQIADIATKRYMPRGPRWSPLTKSYFTCWLCFDVPFGPDKETVATCLIDTFEVLMLFPPKGTDFMLDVIDIMQASRMGIYEHCGLAGKYVILRGLISERVETCFVPAGYTGEKGELWFVRVVPPLNDRYRYSIVITTPYVIQSPAKNEWLAYFRDVLPNLAAGGNSGGGLNQLMKYGLSRLYWPSFISGSFCGHIREAIFLKGLPKTQIN